MQQVFLKLSVAAVVSDISLNINNIPFSVSVQEFTTELICFIMSVT